MSEPGRKSLIRQSKKRSIERGKANEKTRQSKRRDKVGNMGKERTGRKRRSDKRRVETFWETSEKKASECFFRKR